MCIQALSDIVDEDKMDKGKGTIGLLLELNDASIASYTSLVLQLFNKLFWIRLKKIMGSMYWYDVWQGCVLKVDLSINKIIP